MAKTRYMRFEQAWALRRKIPPKLGTGDGNGPGSAYVKGTLERGVTDATLVVVGRHPRVIEGIRTALREGWSVASSIEVGNGGTSIRGAEVHAVRLVRRQVVDVLMARLPYRQGDGEPAPYLDEDEWARPGSADADAGDLAAQDLPFAPGIVARINAILAADPGTETADGEATRIPVDQFDPGRPGYRQYDPSLVRKANKARQATHATLGETCEIFRLTQAHATGDAEGTNVIRRVPLHPTVRDRRAGDVVVSALKPFRTYLVKPDEQQPLPRVGFIIRPRDPQSLPSTFLVAFFSTTAFRSHCERNAFHSGNTMLIQKEALETASVPLPDAKTAAVAEELCALKEKRDPRAAARLADHLRKAQSRDMESSVPEDILTARRDFLNQANAIRNEPLRKRYQSRLDDIRANKAEGRYELCALALRTNLEMICKDWLAELLGVPPETFDRPDAEIWGKDYGGVPMLNRFVKKLKELGHNISAAANPIWRVGNKAAHPSVNTEIDARMVQRAERALRKIIELRFESESAGKADAAPKKDKGEDVNLA